MKIIVLTSCTGEKQHAPDNQLTQDDFRHLHDSQAFQAIEDRLAEYRTVAEDIYTGQQHVRLMKGVRDTREKLGAEAIDLQVLSAGYGFIPGDRAIVPYECTFQTMKPREISQWADHLNAPKDARQLFAQPADFVLVLLGDSYLRALKLDDKVTFAAPTLFFTGGHAQKQVRGQGQVRSVVLSNKEAKRFSCGLVGLKGELAKRLLARLTAEGESFIAKLFDLSTDVLALLDEGTVAVPPARKAARVNPEVDKVIEIPASWWDKPHRAKLRYFIPEWDDLVDPDYDFENDEHSGGMGNWANEVYAHQMYPEPNYDGILISKVVAEKSKSKKERINAMGVHRYVRVPAEFPIMGDCGAFGYIMDEKPPYTTDEILDYYTRLGFNYGVSIDHLIVTATEAQKQFRYELTIHNAEEFLREHQKRGLPWEPIGAVQGWDPQSYAEAARQYVAMGYRYIGLGGLVRTSTPEILRILAEVHKAVPDRVSIHLFGLARIAAISDFIKYGVRSVDSASFLRRAWMGTGQNFLTLDGDLFAAIRIPEAGTSFRAKRMVSEGRTSLENIMRLETDCLSALKDFDNGRLSVDATLNVLTEYDQMITPDRPDTTALLRKTLEDAPWKSCPCEICKKDGFQVIIFRGNNRNRRRGFHNTYVFYRLLQQAVAGDTVNIGWGQEEDPRQLPLFETAGATS